MLGILPCFIIYWNIDKLLFLWDYTKNSSKKFGLSPIPSNPTLNSPSLLRKTWESMATGMTMTMMMVMMIMTVKTGKVTRTDKIYTKHGSGIKLQYKITPKKVWAVLRHVSTNTDKRERISTTLRIKEQCSRKWRVTSRPSSSFHSTPNSLNKERKARNNFYKKKKASRVQELQVGWIIASPAVILFAMLISLPSLCLLLFRREQVRVSTAIWRSCQLKRDHVLLLCIHIIMIWYHVGCIYRI